MIVAAHDDRVRSAVAPANSMYDLAAELFPICRSLTGDGVRTTLRRLQQELPKLEIHSVPSGTTAFDWTVPNEWNIRGAFVLGPNGEKVIDFQQHNLHVVGYSTPVDQTMPLAELDKHLYSLPDQPEAIPYITSYYKERWGFCLRHRDRQRLMPGNYRVVVDSTLAPGELNYGELIIPGEQPEEIFLSTYVCHPSMANNELSGPVVTTRLAQWLGERDRRYTYRIVFIPETIGSIVYLSRHLEAMRARTIAGFVVTCVGDDRAYSYMPSRLGETLADRVALHALKHHAPDFLSYSFLERGSDERQYCAPHVDLPVASMMRSKYCTYPEYHTSDDDLSLITPAGLAGSLALHQKAITILENNDRLSVTVPCEPQLGKRGLYPTISTKDSGQSVRSMMNVIAYCDGQRDLVDLAETVGLSALEVLEICEPLIAAGLLRAA